MAPATMTQPPANLLSYGQPYTQIGGGIAPTVTPAITSTTSGLTKYLPAAQLGLASVQAGGILRQGKQAEEYARRRAEIDRANAIAAKKASIERAKILGERGERYKARQKAQFISGGIRTNVGVPLLVETQTRADIAKDIGFSLDVGRVEAGRFRSSADIEKRIGKFKRRKSRWDAIGIGAGAGLSYLGLTR